jgi:hypothetical protein
LSRYDYPGREALTLLRCPNHRIAWWLAREDTVLHTYRDVTRRPCACIVPAERVRSWPLELCDLGALPPVAPTVEAEVQS